MQKSRHQYWPLLVICGVGCLLAVTAGVGVIGANGAYDLSVSDAVETPSETVEFEGDTYEIDAFAVRDPGESIDVAVTTPNETTDFRVDLYNSDGGVEIFNTGSGSETVTFGGDQTADLEPGTYSLVLNAEANTQAIHPVVISGYDIGASVPEEAPRGETTAINVSVTPTELSGDPSGVEVVLWNEDRVERIDASKTDGTYTATVSVDDFNTGEYNVHAAALGDEEFRGEPEVLGLSDRQTIDVVESNDTSDSENSTDEGSNTNGEDDGNSGESNGGGGGGGASAGGGGGGGGLGGSSPDTTDKTSAESTATAELVDEEPDSPGMQVSFENMTTRAVILSNETATGSVTVADHSSPPADTAEPDGTVIATVEITVPETERNTPATIELAVPAESVNDTDRLTVERYHPENETWVPLDTTVLETSEEMITVTAETPGFSMFVVTETTDEPTSSESSSDEDETTENATDSSASNTSGDDVITPSESDNQSDTPPEEQPGFGLIPTVAAFLIAAGGYLIVGKTRHS